MWTGILSARFPCWFLACAAWALPRELVVTNLGQQDPVAVLLLPSGDDCGQARPVQLAGSLRAGTVSLAGLAASPCANQARLAIFSQDRAAVLLSPEQLRTAGMRVTVELQPPARIPVRVWHIKPHLEAHARDDVANANWILSRNLAGVILDAEFMPWPGDQPSQAAALASAQPSDEPEDCQKARASIAYAPGKINVYYGRGENQSCRDVIFISSRPPELGVLLHEFAHSFGINTTDGDPEITFNSGHVPLAAGVFDGANTMWNHSLIFKDSFTLGQSFWLNFAAESRLCQTRGGCLDCRGDPKQCLLFRDGFPSDPRPALQTGLTLNRTCPVDHVSRMATARDIRLAIAADALRTPRYCTQSELIGVLRERFTEVCASGACGSGSETEFVERWRDHTASGIAAWLSEASMKIFEQRRRLVVSCLFDPECRRKADETERIVREYIMSDKILGIKDRRILWVEAPGRVQRELEVLEKLLLRVQFVNNEAEARQSIDAAKDDPYELVISNRRDAFPLLDHLGKRIPLIIYADLPYDGTLPKKDVDEAKQRGAVALTDCPFELYQFGISRLLEPSHPAAQ